LAVGAEQRDSDAQRTWHLMIGLMALTTHAMPEEGSRMNAAFG
jgi:hypothetical protein